MRITTKLWIGLGVLILLSPLGFLLPEHFKAGAAWGEWRADTFKGLVGYIPQGLEKLSRLWSAPLPGYTFKGGDAKGLARLSLTYIISAFIGIAVVVAAALVLGKFLAGKDDSAKK